ncbi:glycosyltransferase [uncultured Thiohalocapsa sp.]|uniref:glycosyltransferase n=1 Tax=uncultured Thiohalocapsa sp. TaxID=768990 RepID=UPI0025D49D7A|nr:glycosyltransferase [uncultured Thiohalocapsa sp.]
MIAIDAAPRPLPLQIGYVLRRFPTRSRTFVTNEILALERRGHRITVLALNTRPEDLALAIPGAAGRPVRRLSQGASRRWPAALLWLLRAHPLRLARTLVWVLSRPRRYLWRVFTRAVLVARQAERDGLGHLHAHLLMGTDVAWMTHRLTGIGFSFTAHSANIFVPKKTVLLGPELCDACFAVTVCESNRRLMATYAPAAFKKIQVIRPFLRRALLADPPIGRTGEGNCPLQLVSVSRLVAKKGVEVLIRAVKRLSDRGIAVQTTIVGDGEERARLTALIESLGMAGQVSLPGATDAAGVQALLAAADCFVLASVRADNGDSDATPTVLGEAMAMRLPVVSTQIGGIPESVPEGAGVLVPPDDPQALADAIAAVAALSPEERRRMGARGRAFVEAHWHPDKDAERLDALFEHAMRGRSTDNPRPGRLLTTRASP